MWKFSHWPSHLNSKSVSKTMSLTLENYTKSFFFFICSICISHWVNCTAGISQVRPQAPPISVCTHHQADILISHFHSLDLTDWFYNSTNSWAEKWPGWSPPSSAALCMLQRSHADLWLLIQFASSKLIPLARCFAVKHIGPASSWPIPCRLRTMLRGTRGSTNQQPGYWWLIWITLRWGEGKGIEVRGSEKRRSVLLQCWTM